MTKTTAALAVLLAAGLARADVAATYKAKCAVCHGPDGKGTQAGHKLGAKDLTTVSDSEAEIQKVITNGKGKMTAYKGKLSDTEIAELATSVKGLGHK